MTKNTAWVALRVAAFLLFQVCATSAWAQTIHFVAHKDYSSGHRPASVAAGDINGDLVQDLALANSGDDTASVLLGNGDGTFQPAKSVYLGQGAGPQSIVIADFNRNGRPDLAVANTARNAVALLLGNGDGTFQAPVTLGAGVSPSSVTASAISTATGSQTWGSPTQGPTRFPCCSGTAMARSSRREASRWTAVRSS